MKQCILPTGLLLVIAALIGAALYWNGNYVVYILTYVFSFVLLLCHTGFSASSAAEKIAHAIAYTLILAAQIVFAVLVVRPAAGSGPSCDLSRLPGVLIILVPVLVRQIWRSRI